MKLVLKNRLKEIMYSIRIIIGIISVIIVISVPVSIICLSNRVEHVLIVTPIISLIIFALFLRIDTMIKSVKNSKETKRLRKILNEDMDVERFIREFEEAISRTNNITIKKQLAISLGVGYSINGEYQRAIDMMKNIKLEGLDYRKKALYYNNLACLYCEIGNVEAAIQTYSDGEKYIDKMSKKYGIMGSFLNTRGAIEYLKGNIEISEELLEKSKLSLGLEVRGLEDTNLYLAKIYLKTNRIEKAKIILDYTLLQKLYPETLRKTLKVVEEMECQIGKSSPVVQ